MTMRTTFRALLFLSALFSAGAFAQSADLSITKSGPGVASAGSDVAYDISVLNLGPDDATTVQITDPMPPGMTFVSVTQNNGPAFDCSSVPAVGTNGTVTCTIATFTNGSGADFTFTFTIPAATPPGTFFTNQATISSAVSDPNSENDTSTAATSTPSNDADVGVTKNGPASASPGGNVVYTINVVSNGPADAQTVSLTDPLPGNMTFVSIVQNNGPAFNCSSVPAVGTNGTVTCTIATMASGTSANFTLTGAVPGGTAPGTTYGNTASVKSAQDPSPENDSSSVFTTVSTADLGMTKSGPATINAGSNASYTITITNNGPDTATGPQFADTLPSQSTFVSIVQNTGPAASCTHLGSTAGCSWGTLANGVSAQFTLTIAVPNSVPDGTVLTNTVTASSSSTDPNSANDTASTSASVIGNTDLSVTKNGQASVGAGGNITYTITVSNAGPSNANTVQLTDTLPANTTFVSNTQTSGPAFGCTNPSVGSGGTITCNLASLAVGASASFTLVIKTAGNVAGTVSNTANVSTTTNDTNPANNSSTASTNVTLLADLAVSKSGAPPTLVAGAPVTWTIVVSNNGASDAANVTLSDVLDPQTTFVSLGQSGPAFNCTPPAVGANGTVNCSIATLASGASTTFTLVVNTKISAGGTLSNTANVSTTTAEATLANNSATASVTVSPSPLVPALSPMMLMLLGAMLAGIALVKK
jgi:large repetitive protein